MAALPYIQLYVSDYLADTAHLTTEEHGAYLLLIFNYWQTGKPLRADRLASIARLSNERWTDVEQVLNEFFDVQDGKWYHARIDADLEMVNETVEKKSKAGKASAASRKAKRKQELKASNKCSTPEQHLSNKQNITEHNKTEHIYNTKHFKEALLSNGADEIHVNDWLTVRKQKRASNTQTAMNTFMNQVKLSRLSVAQCVEIAAGNSWSGFMAELLNKPTTTMSADTRQSFQSLHDNVRF